MPLGDVAFATIGELSRALATKQVTSLEITERFLARIAKFDPQLHAFVAIYADSARVAAKTADARRAGGNALHMLDGIPFAVKDLFDVKGRPTRAGSLATASTPAENTAHAVQRLLDRGMVLIGKTHTVEFAFGGWGCNPVCGTPVNPWDTSVARVPGGSSSGSGVAVAAGLVPVALGTDTGGSIRTPASLCGIVGHKSTLGLVGRGGVFPLAPTFDTVGPLARSIRDAALVLDALQGRDPQDPSTYGIGRINPLGELTAGVEGLILRAPTDSQLKFVDPRIMDLFHKALGDLKRLGAHIDVRPMPRSHEEYAAHASGITGTEGWNGLSQYIEGLDSRVDRLIAQRMRKSSGISARDYFGLLTTRREMQVEFDRYLEGAAAFLLPSAPIVTPEIEGAHEQTAPFGLLARIANLMDLAAISIPMGLAALMPVGLQITVRRFGDATAFRIAQAFDRERGGAVAIPPGYI
ncbi:amidase [Bradyrhizobium guangdongense]|uniref:Indoleacetamide hydrolase n=1 Tax=Bradyrhizobium guangdongense TaxID=1325090 RepID=A0AA88B860_9BRAD|nr:amidase [Bradyrhizobium guangdongense]